MKSSSATTCTLGKRIPQKTRLLEPCKKPQKSTVFDRLTVMFPEGELLTELICDGELIWSGVWDAKLWIDGEPTPPVGAWNETCWVSDADAAYLELAMDMRGGFRIERHIAYARKDKFLFLADSILGSRSHAIRYESSLPLVESVFCESAKESREHRIEGARSRLTAVPMALPEWKEETGIEDLIFSPGKLTLSAETTGANCFAPLFIDLNRTRAEIPVTWRQLTVAENLQILEKDRAVGFRVAVGKKQWLAYRALSNTANRTFIGHNLSTEFLLGRFLQNGEVEQIVEVE